MAYLTFIKLKMELLLSLTNMSSKTHILLDRSIKTPKCCMELVEKLYLTKTTSMFKKVSSRMTFSMDMEDQSSFSKMDISLNMLDGGTLAINKVGASISCRMELAMKRTFIGTNHMYTQATLE